MNKKQKTFSNRFSRSGLTLIEVVAAITIASMTLGLVLTAVTRHQRQVRASIAQKKSAQLLDQTMSSWFSASSEIPINATGAFKNDPEYAWSTRDTGKIGSWNTRVLEVSVFRVDEPKASRVSIEIVTDGRKAR